MADYFSLLARAVAGLDRNTAENRRALYERARTALLADLRATKPALLESDIYRQQIALEEAIKKVESSSTKSDVGPRLLVTSGSDVHASEVEGRRAPKRNAPTTPGHILISYRRSDSMSISGRVFDRLVDQYGKESVYMDIDTIPFGVDFRAHIRSSLSSSKVVISIIGEDWLGSRQGKAPRIMELNDPVRIEIEIAIERRVPVIPVLVEGASMPGPADLPSSLHDFAFLNAATLDSGRDFHPHMGRLIRHIDRLIGSHA